MTDADMKCSFAHNNKKIYESRIIMQPNIVLFFTDDQRFDTINAIHDTPVKTPNFDRLVSMGTTFTNAHITGGTHGAVCMPSRAMLHTGRNIFQIKDAGESISNNHIMLGETLQANKYTSFGAGKWHNGKESFNRNHNEGSHIFFGGMADHWNVPMFDYDRTGEYTGTGKFIKNPFKTNKTKEYKFDYRYQGKHSSELISQAGIDFIDDYNADNPFFMYLSYLAPHDPRTMPEEYLTMYDPKSIELPDNYLDRYPFSNGGLHNRDEKLASYPRKEEEVKQHIAEYYGMITHLDHEIGRVINKLEEQNLLDNTLIILAGDNGLAVGQHGLMGKQSCHEHSVRVPLIFSGPGIPQNIQSDAFVYLFDIYPTICDYLSINTPHTVNGKSFLDVINDNKKAIRDELYLVYSKHQRAIKTKKYKLIEYVIGGKHTHTQLFNLENDPNEIENLENDSKYNNIIEDLRNKMVFYRDDWEETKTHWGKFYWEGFCKKNKHYAPQDVKNYRFVKYLDAVKYQFMVLKNERK